MLSIVKYTYLRVHLCQPYVSLNLIPKILKMLFAKYSEYFEITLVINYPNTCSYNSLYMYSNIYTENHCSRKGILLKSIPRPFWYPLRYYNIT